MKSFQSPPGSFDDLLFENRNKTFGAYQIRKSQNDRLVKSFVITLVMIAFIFAIPFCMSLFRKKIVEVPVIFDTTVKPMFAVVIEPEIRKPTVESYSPKQNKTTTEFSVVKDSLLTKEDVKKDTMSGMTAIATNSKGLQDSTKKILDDLPSSGGTQSNSGTVLIASAKPYDLVAVDKVPTFKGGENALLNFLENHIHYNAHAKAEGIIGKVYASFIINSKGEVESVKILHGLGYGLDEEVVRVLNRMPSWEPGYFRGKPVSTILNIPVSFNLAQ